MATKTNALTSSILDFLLRQPSCFAWRQNTLPVPIGSGFMRPASKRGVSDIIGVHRGRFFAIEIKTGTDKLRMEQVSFMASVENAGGFVIVASDLEQFREEWNAKARE